MSNIHWYANDTSLKLRWLKDARLDRRDITGTQSYLAKMSTTQAHVRPSQARCWPPQGIPILSYIHMATDLNGTCWYVQVAITSAPNHDPWDYKAWILKHFPDSQHLVWQPCSVRRYLQDACLNKDRLANKAKCIHRNPYSFNIKHY